MDSRQSYWQGLVIVMEKNEGDVYIGKRKRRDLLGLCLIHGLTCIARCLASGVEHLGHFLGDTLQLNVRFLSLAEDSLVHRSWVLMSVRDRKSVV